MADRIKIRRDCRANWELINPMLSVAELGIVTDNNVPGYIGAMSLKVGDGIHRWSDLPEQYFYVSGTLPPDISGSIDYLQDQIDNLSGSFEIVSGTVCIISESLNDLTEQFLIVSGTVNNVVERLDNLNVHDTYVHEQASALAEWHIVHNLDCYPSVTVLDSAGTVCEGEIQYNSLNDLTLRFSSAILGTAYLN